MKETTFIFTLSLTAEDPMTYAETLCEHVRQRAGVLNVAFIKRLHCYDLEVRIAFDSADDAKQLHRALIIFLSKYPGALISEVSTNLSEIFD